ncbi:unnamed protein product [Effrenium voratum]|uniref:Uncharacterized protein n=1 Tax=Effrenium voratum TaxID=2562239 RepID=A0AA36IWB5_9DINO|nr:unnamed protein product [Effrenium voratum]
MTEAFFSALPAEEFESFETELREALINAATRAQELGLPGARFPLQQWIDRRLGGELKAVQDPRGQCEITLLTGSGGAGTSATGAPAAAVGLEAFFSSLSQDSFSKEEEALREAIFDFLAAWTSPDLAKLVDLSSDQNVKAHCKFLPPPVRLQDWVERRIGGEVEFQKDHRGQEVVQVLPEAKKIVAEKFTALRRHAMNAGKANPFPAVGAVGKGGKGVAKGAKGPVPSKEQWLEALPQDELTGEELALRQSVLDWLDVWSKRPGKGKGAAPLIGDVVNDPRVGFCRSALLPQNVSLKDWIEARIGGEVELKTNQRGQVEVHRSGASSGTAPPDASTILDQLPEEALSDEEVALRQAVLNLLSRGGCNIFAMNGHPAVLSAKRRFLPDEVPLRDWIDRRIGGEVEVTAKDWVCKRSEEEPAKNPAAHGTGAAGAPAAPAGKGNGKFEPKGKVDAPPRVGVDSTRMIADNFFKSLPADSFTPAEDMLRDSILAFLENWTEEEAPTLAKAMLDAMVRQCKANVLPKGNVVSLKEWIERRLGGELEIVRNEKGNLVIGIRGDPEPAKRGASQDWDQGPGKAARAE